ncbi:branched-chain alpha-keto acid dehydrogenase subunit E2 [Falsigemmobacter faecalis]|uniref:Dihydrolipoamide acetyltransferase component of pyruvate dehydrogenase complex n=2 Tax=Falsigemmobacter faecalis TaxID=2488730 RepID=A0A3P3DWC6_9RHOB|nr:branched-chain alpha-keto acid dehydrogenase subunit E2 [Falsigemmobacter faecalis]
MQEILIPDMGVPGALPVVEVTVKPGQIIAAGETVLVIEADKATLDVPSDSGGRVLEVLVAVGDQISAGQPMLRLAAEAGVVPPAPAPVAAPAPQPVQAQATAQVLTPASKPPADPEAALYASPSVRRMAFRLGADLAQVTGSGRNGRITPEDVEGFVKTRLSQPPAPGGADLGLAPWPKLNPEAFGPVERLPLSRIGRLSGPALQRNSVLIPHVTNFDEADLTNLDALRKAVNAAEGRKDSILPYIAKACAAALKAHPKFNAVLDGGELILRRYINIGIAADTPEGLVVPVLRDPDRKSVREISDEMAELAADARAGRLKPAAMQGAGFTISSLGGIGGTGFTPIINAPEVAILGLARAKISPVWDGAGFVPRLMQPMALSWDHRASDGVAAAKFLRSLSDYLGDFRRILL